MPSVAPQSVPPTATPQPRPATAAAPFEAFADDAAGASYFRSEPHYRALASAIRHRLARREALVLVLGEPPVSGEMLDRWLTSEAGGGYRVTLLRADAGMRFANVVGAYSARLGLSGDSVVGAEWVLLSHLMRGAHDGIKHLLVIEDADVLDREVLEDLHRFTRLDEQRPTPVVLIATPALAETLDSPAIGCVMVQHLGREQIPAFIAYQVDDPVAMRKLFPPEIIQAIASASDGDPVLVNRMGRLVLTESTEEPSQRAPAAAMAAPPTPAAPSAAPQIVTAPVPAPPATPPAPKAAAPAPAAPAAPPPALPAITAGTAPAETEPASSRERIGHVRQTRRRAKTENAGASPSDTSGQDFSRQSKRRLGVSLASVLLGMAVLGTGVVAWLWVGSPGERPIPAATETTLASPPRQVADAGTAPAPATTAPLPAPVPASRTPPAPAGSPPAPPLRTPPSPASSATSVPDAAATPAPAPRALAPQPVPQPPPAPRTATAMAPPATSPPAHAYRVQVGATRTAEAAQQEWRRLQERHVDLLGGLHDSVFPVTLNGRGVFYRLQAGPIVDSVEAGRLCGELKRRGEQCIVVKP